MSPQGDQNKKNIDQIFDKLDELQLDIEAEELTQGLTEEDLVEKNYIGTGKAVERSKHSKIPTQPEELLFEHNVQYNRFDEDKEWKDIELREIQHVKEIEKGSLIATRMLDSKSELNTGRNVKRLEKTEKEYYYSIVSGRVLIIGKTLHVFPSDIDAKVVIQLDENNLVAYGDFYPHLGNGKAITLDYVLEAMRSAGISIEINTDHIQNVLTQMEQNRKIYNQILIAKGQEPAHGTDGHVRFGVDFNQQKRNFVIREDGTIDYHGEASIVEVQKDQFLAEIIPPKEGTPGTNLFGEEIPPQPGKPSTLRAGQNVYTVQKGSFFYAKADGHVRLDKDMISVWNVFVVNGNVGIQSGNIKFNGDILVKGNVQNGFQIIAEGSIYVQGNVEPSTLRAGCDIVIDKGVLGNAEGICQLTAGRHIECYFVQNSVLQAEGNIIVRDFALQSDLYTCANIIAQEKKGTIIGGKAIAKLSIQANTIGSEQGVKTVLELGADFLSKQKVRELQKVYHYFSQKIEKIEQTIAPAMKLIQEGTQLPEDKIGMLQEISLKKREMESKRSKIKVKIKELEEAIGFAGRPTLNINSKIYSDVNIKVFEKWLMIKKAMNKVQFYYDFKEKCIRTNFN